MALIYVFIFSFRNKTYLSSRREWHEKDNEGDSAWGWEGADMVVNN